MSQCLVCGKNHAVVITCPNAGITFEQSLDDSPASRLAALERELAEERAAVTRAAQDRDISMRRRAELERELAEARGALKVQSDELDRIITAEHRATVAESALAALRKACPWCGDPLDMAHLKSSHGCLTGERDGRFYHAACVERIEQLEQAESDLAALRQRHAEVVVKAVKFGFGFCASNADREVEFYALEAEAVATWSRYQQEREKQ